MAKMYYTEQEAAVKLGAEVAEFAKLVSEGKLRVYPDGDKKMYKAAEVDAIAGPTDEIELKPADSTGVEGISLSDSSLGDGSLGDSGQRPAGKDKEETVLSTEGISIFDEEDLEIEAADPMAKTAITPPVEEQISSEGAGSGSGLLDLTRESDETSLGAEVLEHIDVEIAVPSGTGMGQIVEESPAAPEIAPAYAEPAVVEEADPLSGLFSGLITGAVLVMMLMGAVAISAAMNMVPPYLTALQGGITTVAVIAILIVLVLGATGFFIGKSSAGRSAGMSRSA